MQQEKERFRKRVSLSCLAMIFGVAAYIQFGNLLYLAFGILCGALIMKTKDIPIQ